MFVKGTRIGQASECFVYWKDPMTNDTWGLNFTSPIDAKQFRECCVSSRRSPAKHRSKLVPVPSIRTTVTVIDLKHIYSIIIVCILSHFALPFGVDDTSVDFCVGSE